MIIWTGWGIFVGIVGIACLVATQLIVNAIAPEPRFYETHSWPKVVGGLFAAAVTFPVGRAMNKRNVRQLFDPNTNEFVYIPTSGGHSLFFIPVEHFWIAFVALAVLGLFV